jgi:hypothetical protein
LFIGAIGIKWGYNCLVHHSAVGLKWFYRDRTDALTQEKTMTLTEFAQLPSNPKFLPPALQALWYDRQNNWDRAHEIVQDAKDLDSAWVHAYLHRQEGDLSNARYWYNRSRQPFFTSDLKSEWEHIASNLLMKL